MAAETSSCTPARSTRAVFIINPEHDLRCRDEDVEALKWDVVHPPDVRVWAGKDSTHYIFSDHPDRGKADLMRELLNFLD